MAYIIDGDTLENIADAIRGKTGATDTMTPDQMAAAIDGLEIGGGNTDAEDGIIDGSISGHYTNPRVTKITNDTFSQRKALSSVSFPNVESISSYAFYGCSNLTTIDFPQATSIGPYAFQRCSNLTTVDLPQATSIGTSAFNACGNLQTADFPKVTSIGSGAFGVCANLYAVVLRNEGGVCTLTDTSALERSGIESGIGYIYVPDALVDNYKSASNWAAYADQIKPLSELPEEDGA